MLKLISGTFEDENGILIKDTEDNEYYHKVVYKNSIVHKEKLYYKEDFALFICYETGKIMTKQEWEDFYLHSSEIDRTEYKDFYKWCRDMRISGVILKYLCIS